MVTDAETMAIGAVGALRRVAGAVDAAGLVLRHTTHTLLVGSQASDFASSFGGAPLVALNSTASDRDYAEWTARGCQPNYFRNTDPSADISCGPYVPSPIRRDSAATHYVARPHLDEAHHDTLSVMAVDAAGRIAAATTTNGLSHKIPGRVGDAAVPGAGHYAMRGVGACGATGDGDLLMRFLPCYQAVESLRLGATPEWAAQDALMRVAVFYPGAQVRRRLVCALLHSVAYTLLPWPRRVRWWCSLRMAATPERLATGSLNTQPAPGRARRRWWMSPTGARWPASEQARRRRCKRGRFWQGRRRRRWPGLQG